MLPIPFAYSQLFAPPNAPDLKNLPSPMTQLPPLRPTVPPPASQPSGPVFEKGTIVEVATVVKNPILLHSPSTSSKELGLIQNGTKVRIVDSKIVNGRVAWYFVRWSDEDMQSLAVIATGNQGWISSTSVRLVTK